MSKHKYEEYVEKAEACLKRMNGYGVSYDYRKLLLAEAQVLATIAVAHATMEASEE